MVPDRICAPLSSTRRRRFLPFDLLLQGCGSLLQGASGFGVLLLQLVQLLFDLTGRLASCD
jgi:hypothetical protein